MARYWRRWAGVRRWPARRAFNCAQGLDDVPDVPTCPRAAAARTRPMQRAARPVHARNSTRSILNRNPEAFNPGAPTSLVTEREGFEPSTHLSARTRFPVALLRPLGHLSGRRHSTTPARNSCSGRILVAGRTHEVGL